MGCMINEVIKVKASKFLAKNPKVTPSMPNSRPVKSRASKKYTG
jgi:hypothetical protein